MRRSKTSIFSMHRYFCDNPKYNYFGTLNKNLINEKCSFPQMTELVRGEASESDEETHIKRNNIFASEVPGEATESDEDLYEKIGAELSSEHITELRYKNSLLQRKLSA
ncbi:PREDICTED: biogenesis of lysosome-related organelles complex 1 subunit 3-like [Rhagoletis zephyria]|uniref:biogenesis of lysosome-related organelles complex 1 subunit 3-like n=1 Tax=Rhagoletis zephyria TaxID=28612 RepID=UPI00081183D1|nr:PREDICTED: biogenesis of lysosome-related organelles complex 1 subunit 3-like [Rhagoletis zephyria]